MKKYIKSAKLPQFYEYSDYRFKIGDVIHVSQYWGDPVDIQGVVYDIYNDVLYIVPKDMYVEGKKDYAWDNEIDLNADGLTIDLILPYFEHSFYYNDKRKSNADIIEFLKSTKKPIKYTYGLAMRHPTTYKVPISIDEAIQKVKTEPLLDVKEYSDYINMNAYSDNDMW